MRSIVFQLADFEQGGKNFHKHKFNKFKTKTFKKNIKTLFPTLIIWTLTNLSKYGILY